MLLDTHTFLWFLEDDPKLPPAVRQIIETTDGAVISIINLWEIAIKLSVGKLDLQFEFAELQTLSQQLDLEIVPLAFADIQCYVNLPLHHRDPFDRMLIAQAINQSLPLISADSAFDAYPVQRIWA